MSWQILQGDARERLAGLEAGSVHCCVTSPPYLGLRDYGCEGQLGLEETPEEFVAALVSVFREVRRVLREDGTLWLNLGDSYAAQGGCHGGRDDNQRNVGAKRVHEVGGGDNGVRKPPSGLKPKDLIGIPWMVAFALRADGWYLRSEVIWAKPNPMPESVTDRPTKSHEQLFLLAKSPVYFYDAEAIREKAGQPIGTPRLTGQHKADAGGFTTNGHGASSLGTNQGDAFRNCRSVWTLTPEPYAEAHFATFPTALVKPCILAGTSEEGVCSACGAPRRRMVEKESRPNQSDNNGKHDGTHYRTVSGGVWNDRRETLDLGWGPSCTCAAPAVPATVLDPFAGSGTTGSVAIALGRAFVGIELSEEYCKLARRRIGDTNPSLFSIVE